MTTDLLMVVRHLVAGSLGLVPAHRIWHLVYLLTRGSTKCKPIGLPNQRLLIWRRRPNPAMAY